MSYICTWDKLIKTEYQLCYVPFQGIAFLYSQNKITILFSLLCIYFSIIYSAWRRYCKLYITPIAFIDIALLDLNDLASITPFYNSLFPQGQKPARTIYQAAALPFGGKIKVLAVAIKV